MTIYLLRILGTVLVVQAHIPNSCGSDSSPAGPAFEKTVLRGLAAFLIAIGFVTVLLWLNVHLVIEVL